METGEREGGVGQATCRADKGSEMCNWVWQSGDGKGGESPRASGEQVENGNECC